MAEALVSALLKNLAPRMIQEFGFAWDAIKDLRKLESTFLTIKDVLEDAESQSMKNKPLFNWLAKLEDATYDMEDLLDYVKMETERRKLDIHGHIIKEDTQTGDWVLFEGAGDAPNFAGYWREERQASSFKNIQIITHDVGLKDSISGGQAPYVDTKAVVNLLMLISVPDSQERDRDLKLEDSIERNAEFEEMTENRIRFTATKNSDDSLRAQTMLGISERDRED